MSQMRSPGSGIKLTASASIFQIPLQLIFIEEVYLAGNDLGTSTYAILRTVVKALQGSNIMATVKMRLSDSFKVTQLSVAEREFSHHFVDTQDWFQGWSVSFSMGPWLLLVPQLWSEKYTMQSSF